MIGRRNQRVLVPLALIAVGLALAWLIYQELQGQVNANLVERAPDPPAVPVLDAETEVNFRMPPLRKFDAILKRPLFTQSRRPSTAPTKSAVVVSRNLGLSLIGITIASDGKYALVLPEGGGETVRLREGQDYRGWTLSVIESKNIVFEREGIEERLELSYDVAPPPQPKRKANQTPAKKQSRDGSDDQRRKKDTGQQGDEDISD